MQNVQLNAWIDMKSESCLWNNRFKSRSYQKYIFYTASMFANSLLDLKPDHKYSTHNSWYFSNQSMIFILLHMFMKNKTAHDVHCKELQSMFNTMLKEMKVWKAKQNVKWLDMTFSTLLYRIWICMSSMPKCYDSVVNCLTAYSTLPLAQRGVASGPQSTRGPLQRRFRQ